MSNKTTNTRTKLFVDTDVFNLQEAVNAFLETLIAPPISITFHIRPETHSGAEDYVIMVVYTEPINETH